MKHLDKPLNQLTAGDLMSLDVIAVPGRMSLRVAAQLLAQAHVSGAPVIDDDGRCIGVLSTTDFLRLASGEQARHAGAASCICCEWQVFEGFHVPEEAVAERMTPNPVTVRVDTPLAHVTCRMLDAHIHRVVVVDEQHHPVGIVSTTDILAAVACQVVSQPVPV